MDDSLEEYRRKRALWKTGEPRGKKSAGGDRWVIQKHDASSLHYDFRLEVNGVMKSWAPAQPDLHRARVGEDRAGDRGSRQGPENVIRERR